MVGGKRLGDTGHSAVEGREKLFMKRLIKYKDRALRLQYVIPGVVQVVGLMSRPIWLQIRTCLFRSSLPPWPASPLFFLAVFISHRGIMSSTCLLIV